MFCEILVATVLCYNTPKFDRVQVAEKPQHWTDLAEIVAGTRVWTPAPRITQSTSRRATGDGKRRARGKRRVVKRVKQQEVIERKQPKPLRQTMRD